MSRAFLDYAIPWLVDNPGDVTIDEVEGETGGVVYEISVHPDDMGKIIGRRGRIIRSLRTLARAGGQTEGRPVSVEVID
jgi:predicted RNA-binding protein YlqC (UPF0109 family)